MGGSPKNKIHNLDFDGFSMSNIRWAKNQEQLLQCIGKVSNNPTRAATLVKGIKIYIS